MSEIRGWLTESESSALAKISRGKIVLEVGSFCGKSTITMAKTAVKVYALDWHKGDIIVDKSNSGNDTLPEFRQNLHDANIQNVVPLVGRTQDLFDVLGNGWADVAFIDGCHLEESVRADIELAKRCLKSSGLIALHDWDREQVRRAFLDLMGADSVSLIVDSLMISKPIGAKGIGMSVVMREDLLTEIACLDQQLTNHVAAKRKAEDDIVAVNGAMQMAQHLLKKINDREAVVKQAKDFKAGTETMAAAEAAEAAEEDSKKLQEEMRQAREASLAQTNGEPAKTE